MSKIFFRRKDILKYLDKRGRECIKSYRCAIKRCKGNPIYNEHFAFDAYRHLVYARENRRLKDCFAKQKGSIKIKGYPPVINVIEKKKVLSSVSRRCRFIENYLIPRRVKDKNIDYLLAVEEIKRFILVVEEFPLLLGGFYV